jgi:glutamate dehydrogenase
VVGGPPPELSQLVPVLEATGLRVSEDMTFALDGDVAASVLDLAVAGPELDDDDAVRLAETVRACWSGRAEVDHLNSLVLGAALTWEQVAVLRAYARYLPQVRPGTAWPVVEEALAENPAVARALWDRFAARFAPSSPGDTSPAAVDEPGRDVVLAACDGVARLDQDRVLRDLAALVDATVRTNAFAEVRSGSVTLALDGTRLPGVGRARTWRELWVSSPRVEGVHLRAGPVARGGLRWSDRSSDLRTEVLQLMAAQELKNALIVPTGAKGGFVLRRRPADPTELRRAVRDSYSTFVRSLLDVVDDLDGDRVVHPAGVRPADGADTYLVVAADRGTADLSDLANSFAVERGHWLGDAFASGGSAGYDHKALGVTARGAWVSVAEHFEGLGVDVSRDPFTAVGVGDMSGDVFGNGMLLSPGMRLVAAFDHRHVFIDPDPDPEASRAERQRLFELPRSSWDDYDRDALSAGGMVVPRSAKRVALTDEARAALDLETGEPTLPELVRAVLRAPADLLYFGGIGTFVRGDDETDADVGDGTNDEVRVDAAAVRARVVVEGANLALTPRARVDLAGRGVCVNSDAVDNSAGVDCSDHEVNLKILLGLAERDGRLDRAGRDRRLAAAADEVVAATLANVARQNRALGRAATDSARSIEPYLSLLFSLEADGRVDRALQALPPGAEVRRRRDEHRGLRRPELAVLMAAAKERLAGVVAGSDLPDRPQLDPLGALALPASAVEEFGDLLARHPLRRAMVASRLANEVVDRMGMTWASETSRRSDADEVTVLAAYWMARCTARLGEWWAEVDRAPLQRRDGLWDPAVQVIDALAGDYLRRGAAAAWRWDEVERSAEAAEVLAPGDPATGSPEDLWRVALCTALADVAHRAGRPAAEVLPTFLDAGRRFGADRLTWALLGCRVDPGDPWVQRHRDSLLFDVDRLRRAAALALLDPVGEERAAARLADWEDRLDAAVDAGDRSLDPLAVAVAELWLRVEDLGGRIPRS